MVNSLHVQQFGDDLINARDALLNLLTERLVQFLPSRTPTPMMIDVMGGGLVDSRSVQVHRRPLWEGNTRTVIEDGLISIEVRQGPNHCATLAQRLPDDGSSTAARGPRGSRRLGWHRCKGGFTATSIWSGAAMRCASKASARRYENGGAGGVIRFGTRFPKPSAGASWFCYICQKLPFF
jgi:hypothetical protein